MRDRDTGERSIFSIHEAQILQLPQDTVSEGLGTLLVERVNSVYEDDIPKDEKKWQCGALLTTYLFIDQEFYPSNPEGPQGYRNAVIRTLRLMNFLGFSEQNFFPQNIQAASQRKVEYSDWVEEYFPDSSQDVVHIETEKIKRGIPQRYDEDLLQNRLEEEMMLDDERKQLANLENVMYNFPSFPSFEQYLEWEADKVI